MLKFFRSALLIGLCLLAIGGTTPAAAVPASGQREIAGHARGDTISPVVAELGQQIQALVTGDQGDIEPEETFGTRALGVMLSFFDLVVQEGGHFLSNFAAWPQFAQWFSQQASDSTLSDRWNLIGMRLLMVVGGAFIAGFLADLVLLPARRRLRRREPRSFSSRFGALLTWLIVSAVPVVVFLAAALALMDQNQQAKVVRYVVMTVVYALAMLRLVRLGTRFLIAPRTPNLRLTPLTTAQAVYVQRWLDLFAFVMILGYFAIDVAKIVRVPADVIMAWSSAVGLIVVSMAIAVILQKRASVSSLLRGDLSAAQHGLTLWQSTRLWLARTWHRLAILYLAVGYLVTTLRAEGGFALMQRGTILTLLTLFAVRLGFYLTNRMRSKRHAELDSASQAMFFPVLRGVLKVAIWTLGVGGIAAAWGVDVEGLILSPWGQRISGSAFTIVSTLMLVVLAYEGMRAAIDRKLREKDDKDNHAYDDASNARARTLLPMLRNAAMLVLAVIVGLVTLSELGINIAPLLAGAGVIGVAVGFGSQTLVKDFLTGLFIILENTIAVGDIVTIGDKGGVVEGITIRTVRLRDFDGSLHILPFSEITKFTNMTKGHSFAVADISVAYDSDLHRVIRVLEEEGQALGQDPVWSAFILEPMRVFGVENFSSSSIDIRCRVKVKPGKQWDIRRAFLLRVKDRFDAEKIVIPFQTVVYINKSEHPS